MPGQPAGVGHFASYLELEPVIQQEYVDSEPVYPFECAKAAFRSLAGIRANQTTGKRKEHYFPYKLSYDRSPSISAV
jgi:hypothetical protein